MSSKPRTVEQLDARVLARTRLEAMRRRTRRIRRSVTGFALALFVASFTIVYVQLASGHDPALVSNARKRAAATSAASSSAGTSSSSAPGESTTGATSTGESTKSGESSSASEPSSSESGESSTGASPVTTSQS
jgi:hypothetical protein